MTKILNVLDKIKEKLDDQTQDILSGESTLGKPAFFSLI
jgi:hypothetical protein